MAKASRCYRDIDWKISDRPNFREVPEIDWVGEDVGHGKDGIFVRLQEFDRRDTPRECESFVFTLKSAGFGPLHIRDQVALDIPPNLEARLTITHEKRGQTTYFDP